MSEIELKALAAKLESNALAYEMLGEKQLPALLREAAAALAPQWQPIESAPKDGTFYLATNGKLQRVENCPPGHVAGIWHRIDGDWRGHALGDDSTHWQPLPAPPEVSNGQ